MREQNVRHNIKWNRIVYLILAFIPFVNSLSWLILDSYVPNKKWRIYGWCLLLPRIALFPFVESLEIFSILLLLSLGAYLFTVIGVFLERASYLSALNYAEMQGKDMALHQKSFSWKFINSLHMIPCFLCGFSFISFFIMNSRVKNKTWWYMAWGSLATYIISFILITYSFDFNYEMNQILQVTGTMILISFYFISFFYMVWQNHYYLSRLANQSNQQAFLKQSQLAQNAGVHQAFAANVPGQPAYSRAPVTKTPKQPAYSPTPGTQVPMQPAVSPVNPAVVAGRPAGQAKPERAANAGANAAPVPSVTGVNRTASNAAPVKKIDINNASEQELASLPGLTIVDAKKAVQYREKNGGFDSVDSFFEILGLKPHVVARLMDRIVAGEKKADKKSPQNPARRRFDF